MGKIGSVARTALNAIVPIGAAAAGFAIAKFAAESIKAATEFNKQMTQIDALTNVTAQRMSGLTDVIINLSRETAQSPVDLAHSLYFLASAGLTVSQQMETLEATAKGAAVQLGDAGDLATISAQALNVFSDNGLKAADVMDVIVAAIREGTAEPDEFSAALGRVLPIADKAGLSFQQVAASLATMSNAGLKVNLGVTSLRALLQSLVSPTNQTRDALQSIGLTVDDVVVSMQQQGLISTLRMLEDRTKSATDTQGEFNITMRNLIPNVRGLTGAFNLTGQKAKEVDKIFEDVLYSTGSLDEAFNITAASPAFRMQQAMNQIGIVGMQLAQTTLPTIASALELIARNFEGVIVPIIKMLAALVAIKIGIAIFTALTGAASAFAIAMQLVGAAIAVTVSGPLGPLSLLLVAVGTAMLVISGNSRGAVVALAALVIEIGAVSGALTAAQARMGAFALAAYAVNGAINAVQGLQQQTNDMAGSLTNSMLKGKSSLDEYRTAVEAVNPHQNILAGLISGTTLNWEAFNKATEQVTQAIKAQNEQILRGTPVYRAYEGILDSTANTNLKLHGALASVLRAYYLQTGSLDSLNTQQIDAWVSAGKLAKAVDYVKNALGGYQAALAAAAEQSDAAGSSAKNYNAILDQTASVIGTTTEKLTQGLQDASTDGKAALDDFINTTLSSVQDWHDEIAGQVTGVTDVLSDLAGKSNLSATEIHNAFQQAAEDARDFTDDLVTISNTGGATGKALAQALLTIGPSAAGMASTIAGSGKDMRGQLVSDFGKILSAGQNAADRLQNALVGPLKAIKKILEAIAAHWGIDVALNNKGETLTGIDAVKSKLQDITGHSWDVHIALHTGPRSPWPDEAIQMHLVDPMKRTGFKRGSDGAWTLAANVGMHTGVGGAGAGGREGGHQWSALVNVEKDSRAYLKVIAKHSEAMGHAMGGGGQGGSGGGTSGTSGTGSAGGSSGGGGATASDALATAVAKIVGTVNKYATTKEGMGVVEAVSKAGLDSAFIMKAVAQVSQELGKTAAQQYRAALKLLDQATLNGKNTKAAIAAAKDAVTAINEKAQARKDARAEPPAWIELSGKNVPRLPFGNTHIDKNEHERDRRHRKSMTIHLDRKHYADSMTQEVSYGRGY